MSVLERLAGEVRAAQQRREAEDSAEARRAGVSIARLSPALTRATRYLDDLAGHLNALERRIDAHYRIDDLGVLGPLQQESYAVIRADGPDAGVRLDFACTGCVPLVCSSAGHVKAEALARDLRAAGLVCRLNPASEKVMELRVEARVPVRVDFAPDLERGVVQLTLRNLTGLGVQHYHIPTERLDEELLDALAHLVLRESSAFAQLTGSVVDDAQREDLQRELARETRRRNAELAGGLRSRVFPLAEWFRRRYLGG
jgi:hypothetical protein